MPPAGEEGVLPQSLKISHVVHEQCWLYTAFIATYTLLGVYYTYSFRLIGLLLL